MTTQNIYRIGISGHRDLKSDNIAQYQRQIEKFLEEQKQSYYDKEIRVVSPLADGADRLMVKAAQNTGLEYEVYLPMPKELYVMDFDTTSLPEFEQMLEGAKIIQTTPFCPGCNLQNISFYGIWRDRQYQYMGFTLVDKTDKMLFLFDGDSDTLKIGGTADILAYAREQNKPLEVISVVRG